MRLSTLRTQDPDQQRPAGHGSPDSPGSRVRGTVGDCSAKNAEMELAADATSPAVQQDCTAMSREQPEAVLGSYRHFFRRRANDRHAHGTFLQP